AESPGLVEQTPGDDGGMVEVPMNRLSHHHFVTASSNLGITSFAKIRKIGHQKNAENVRVIKNERIIHLNMNPEEIETGTFRFQDIVLDHFDIARGVNAFGIIRLVKSAAQVDGFAVKAKCSWSA